MEKYSRTVFGDLLESDILNRMHKRFVQSFLDVVILLELNKRPLSDNDVVSFIQNKHNILLNSGTVCTYLNSLEKDGLVKSDSDLKKRVYVLTDLGKETAREVLNARTKILGLLLNLFVSE